MNLHLPTSWRPKSGYPVGDCSAAEAFIGVRRISAAEWRRRLFHMLPGVLAVVIAPIPHPARMALTDIFLVSACVLTLAAFVRRNYSLIARPGEDHWTSNVVKYCGAVIAMLVAFPRHPEFASVVVTVVALGDGSASLFGLLLGHHPLPWNPRKTWEGFLAFLLCSLPMATLAYWWEASPIVPFHVAATCALSAVVCGQIAETLPLNSSDNLRVGVAAAIGVLMAHLTVFGSIT